MLAFITSSVEQLINKITDDEDKTKANNQRYAKTIADSGLQPIVIPSPA